MSTPPSPFDDDDPTPRDGRNDETEQERLNRQLNELLQEIRVAMPGVQILFAFLLVVPFNGRFGETTDFQVKVYLVALLASALASACFIAPTAYHRIMFERGDKPRLIATASRLAIAGLTCLAIAMTCAIFLVVDFLFNRTTSVIATGLCVAAFLGLWFGLAMSRRLSGKRSP